MTGRRIEAGPLVAALGALLLLIGLFLEWWQPGLSAWEAFEVLDLVLAACAVVALLAAAAAAGAAISGLDPRALGWAAGIALVVVVASLLDAPPAARDADREVGSWLALAGAALLAVGALLSLARVRVALDIQARRTRAGTPPRTGEEATAAMPPEDGPPPESRL